MKWWDQLMRANETVDFATALGIAVSVWLVLALAKRYGAQALSLLVRRTETRWDDILADSLRATSLIVLLPAALYAGALTLHLPPRLERFLELAAVAALLLQSALWMHRLIGRWAGERLAVARQHEPEEATALGLIAIAARVVLWALVLLLALDQLGFDITALVAGLGIGGVAVALAVQSILGDLFASLSIVLDKPFVVGDFVVVGDMRGTIEYIGLKTTRVRSLDGEVIVFSNADLLKCRIRNFKQMQERRIAFSVGVTYQTPLELARRIPAMLREAVDSVEPTRFDRAHFAEYGDFALRYEVVYYVLSPEYNVYMNAQQAINLEIFRRFAEAGIEFAYPTQTVFVQGVQAPAAQVAG